MGLSDLSKEENKGQDYFTGGQASGMVVRDPQKKDGANIVNELMDNARRCAFPPPPPPLLPSLCLRPET